METKKDVCPDCTDDVGFNRRDFLRTAGVAAVAAAGMPLWATPKVVAAPTPKSAAETAVKGLYDSLTEEQRKTVCFAWDYIDEKNKRGLLRTHVSNNWQITQPRIRSSFYTPKQQDIMHDIFKGLINPEWYGRFLQQLKDDTQGKLWGSEQSIAIFGKPGDGKFEFVMTGRHMTLRADGASESNVAFGGPIFYGHQATTVTAGLEKTHHPGNVFWPQALEANKLFKMLDGKQQEKSLVARRPAEAAVEFRGKEGKYPGLPVTEMVDEQKKALQKVLMSLVEPFRMEDRDEALACLQRQGGLDKCSLAFYRDGDIGDDGEWDNWRLEGPAFVWYFRGEPHVHVWVSVADDPSRPLNARG